MIVECPDGSWRVVCPPYRSRANDYWRGFRHALLVSIAAAGFGGLIIFLSRFV